MLSSTGEHMKLRIYRKKPYVRIEKKGTHYDEREIKTIHATKEIS